MVEEQVCTQTREIDDTACEVEVIADPVRFGSIGTDWDDLVQRAAVDHPFLSHSWLRTWWECFGAGKQLHVVVVRHDGRLVAAAPMMRTRCRMYGMNVDALTSIYNFHTPRWDFIIAGEKKSIYPLIWRELSSTDCDLVALRQIPTGSPTTASMDRLAEDDGWLRGRWTSRPSPYIPLGCTYGELINRLKGSYRYNLRKRQERLAKLGPIDVEVIKEKDAVSDGMRDGLRIEAAAWKGRQGTAILSDPAVTAFYMRLAERQAELGQLRLSFLRADQKRISFSYILQRDKTLYGVKIGYDPDYHTYSPGNMLLSLVLQDACERGLNEYDFLGVDDEWKFEWTGTARSYEWLFLFPNQWRSRLLHSMKFSVVPRVKPCISRLGLD